MKVGIVIICYNIDSRIFLLQIDALKKFCTDDFEINVFDNGYEKEKCKAIKYHCERMGIEYKRTKASSKNGSDSHAFAANFAYNLLKDKYDYFFYVDHDLIPIKSFSILQILGIKILAGVGQGLKAKYTWPGAVAWNNTGVDKSLIDFTPDHTLGLDTGAGFYKIIEKYGEENCVFFDEEYHQNPDYTGEYNFYSLIFNGTFFHCINASNWNHVADNDNRINSLLNIIKEKMDAYENVTSFREGSD